MSFDAVCLTIGAMKPRTLVAEGADMKGIHFAMDFLNQQNKINRGMKIPDEERILATDKNVIIIGGGRSYRLRLCGTSTTERYADRDPAQTSRNMYFRLSGQIPCGLRVPMKRDANAAGACLPKTCSGRKGRGKKIKWWKLQLVNENGKTKMVEKPETHIGADLVLLAMGFDHHLAEELGSEFDPRGNIKVDKNFSTSKGQGVCSRRCSHRGENLVVRQNFQGRNLARSVDNFLRKNK